MIVLVLDCDLCFDWFVLPHGFLGLCVFVLVLDCLVDVFKSALSSGGFAVRCSTPAGGSLIIKP